VKTVKISYIIRDKTVGITKLLNLEKSLTTGSQIGLLVLIILLKTSMLNVQSIPVVIQCYND